MSINNIVDSLRKNGNKITKPTVIKYVQALLDAKIIYDCSRYDMKSKKSIKGEKKYYLADLSFYYALNTDNQMNYGPCLENIVYIELLRRGYDVNVGVVKDKEIDFAREGITIINSNSNGINITIYMNKVSLIERKEQCKH